jgi:membrane associated rhomboid family serine protease
MVTTMGAGSEIPLETVADEAHARDWELAVAAAGVPVRVERRADGWAVMVPAAELGRARAALAAYLADVPPASSAAELEYGPTRAGLVMAVVLLLLVPFTGFRADGRAPFVAGQGSAARILRGQPWRAVTALTLHGDATHLVGNVAAMGVLGTAVCRLLGPGLGAALILLAGAGGNLLNAGLRGSPHIAVGASTAIFGALGILVGLAVLRARPPRGRAWVPIAAGLALLGLLGAGERADLTAHFLGFQVGIGLGVGAGVALEAPPGPAAQRWLATATVAVVVGSWALAMASTAWR